MLKRTLALALAAMMLLSVTSCASGVGNTTTPAITEDPANVTDPVTDVSVTGVYETLKNDIYLDDYEFNIHLSGNSKHTPDDFTVAETGSVMDEAIFQKNALMAEKYGVLFTADNTFGSASTAEQMMRRSDTAGENEYQLCILGGYTCSTLAIEGILYDIKELPNVDLSHTWWDQTAMRDLSIANSMFFATGALSTAIDDFTFCVLFNKELFKEKVGVMSVKQLSRTAKERGAGSLGYAEAMLVAYNRKCKYSLRWSKLHERKADASDELEEDAFEEADYSFED